MRGEGRGERGEGGEAAFILIAAKNCPPNPYKYLRFYLRFANWPRKLALHTVPPTALHRFSEPQGDAIVRIIPSPGP